MTLSQFLGRKEPNLNHKYLVEFGELKSVFVAVCPSVLIFCGACDGFAFLSFAHNSGNYAFIVSHDFQAEKMKAMAVLVQVLFWWFRVLWAGPGPRIAIGEQLLLSTFFPRTVQAT